MEKTWLLSGQTAMSAAYSTLPEFNPIHRPNVAHVQRVQTRLQDRYGDLVWDFSDKIDDQSAAKLLKVRQRIAKRPRVRRENRGQTKLGQLERAKLDLEWQQLEKQALLSLKDVAPVGHEYAVYRARRQLVQAVYLPGTGHKKIQNHIQQLTDAVVAARQMRKSLVMMAEPLMLEAVEKGGVDAHLAKLMAIHLRQPSANLMIQLHVAVLERALRDAEFAQSDHLAVVADLELVDFPHDAQLQSLLSLFWQQLTDLQTPLPTLIATRQQLMAVISKSRARLQALQCDLREILQKSRQMLIANEPAVIGAQHIMQTVVDDDDFEVQQLQESRDWFLAFLDEEAQLREDALQMAQRSVSEARQAAQNDLIAEKTIVLDNLLAERKATTRDLLTASQDLQQAIQQLSAAQKAILKAAYKALEDGQIIANEPNIQSDIAQLREALKQRPIAFDEIASLTKWLGESVRSELLIHARVTASAEDLMNQIRASAVAHEIVLEQGVLALQQLILQRTTSRAIQRTIQRLRQDFTDALTARRGAILLARSVLQTTVTAELRWNADLVKARRELHQLLVQSDTLTAHIIRLSKRVMEVV